MEYWVASFILPPGQDSRVLDAAVMEKGGRKEVPEDEQPFTQLEDVSPEDH